MKKRARKKSIVKRVRKKSRVPVKVGGMAPTAASLHALLHDLRTIRDEMPELYKAIEKQTPMLFLRLFNLIDWLLLPDGFIWEQTANRDWLRHRLVRDLLNSGVKRDAVFERAAGELKKQRHPAAVGSDQIEKVYKRRASEQRRVKGVL
jgi:hypothetical protein